ncbi:TonB-dependent receptor domain-containing protein [Segatella copri]|uniref:TonB-dependent receptor domain-containing protein n=1 Tax=Segatella copri TaxID=165179 RepID=UPI0022310DA1|nr:outer membrane beta-barrel family protein [Segatella copri]MCW4075402.1 outer membrane beta-barrel family protein [Segatella copri]
MKRLALVASFCGITITQMMAQNINGEQISDTTLFDKFSKELGEVVVKAHLPQYKKTHEGLLTNVAGTVLSKMGTAEDVLKHVPSIVKKKDGYEVVGKGTPIIYINGRKMQDISELDNIKSSDIKSVEVIQNPGATYDASVNAVIKIKTIKKKGEGFGFDTRSVYWYNKHDNTIQQVNMNYRHNGLNLFTTYKFSDATWMQKATYEQAVHVDTLWQQHNNNEVTGRIESHRLISGFSYDFNANHSIGARYTLTSPGYSRSKDFFDSQVTADDKFYDYIKTDGLTVDKDNPSHQLNAYYNGTLGKTTIDLNTDLYFSTNRAYAYSDEQSQEHDSRNINSKNRVSNKMVATKLVITSPLLGGNLSYGAEYIHTRRNDDYEVNRTDLLTNSYSKLEEQTASPFIQYARLTPIGNITAGLRYEYVRFKYYDAGIYQPEQSRSFRNLFPTISYGAKIGKVMAQLSYSVKTSRPSYSQLSNNVSYMNRFTRQTGNPYLDNETNHRVELSGVWKFIQFMVNYRDSRNAIIYWAEQIPGNEAITMISRKNVKSLKNMTAYISAAPKIGIWAPQINLGMQKPWFTLHTDVASYRLNRPIFMGNFNNALSLPCGITLNVDYRYQSKGNTMNVYLAKEQHVLDVSISKSFLKDALTLEIKGNDLLYKCWDADLLYNQKMELLQVSKRGTRDLQLTLRYKFNTTRSKYKGTGAGNAELNRL